MSVAKPWTVVHTLYVAIKKVALHLSLFSNPVPTFKNHTVNLEIFVVKNVFVVNGSYEN